MSVQKRLIVMIFNGNKFPWIKFPFAISDITWLFPKRVRQLIWAIKYMRLTIKCNKNKWFVYALTHPDIHVREGMGVSCLVGGPLICNGNFCVIQRTHVPPFFSHITKLFENCWIKPIILIDCVKWFALIIFDDDDDNAICDLVNLIFNASREQENLK